jgi:hypothetical protein
MERAVLHQSIINMMMMMMMMMERAVLVAMRHGYS